MATVAGEAYPSSANRQALTSRAFSCEKGRTTDASVSAVAAGTSHQTFTPRNDGNSRARMCDASESKLSGFSPKPGSLQDEDEDFFLGVRGLASAVLRDLSGWVTGQFDSTSHPTSSTTHHLPKAKTEPPAVEHPESSAPHVNSVCSTAAARCSYAESAKSGSTSCSSSSLMIRQKHDDKRKKSEGFSLYRLFQGREGCPLGSENPDPQEETVPSTRATSHSHVNSQVAFPEKDAAKISSVSLGKRWASLTEVTQWDKSSFTTNVGDTATDLPSSDGFVQNGKSTCKHRNYSPEKEATVPRVYEASYPGVSRWEGNAGGTAQHYRERCSSRTERKDACSSLTILTTSMKPRRNCGDICLESNNLSPAAPAQDTDRAAGMSPRHVNCYSARSTGKADAETNVLRAGGGSVSSLCTGAATGTTTSSGRIIDDPSVCSLPQAKNSSEPAVPAATSFLSSFTNSFREHFEAATKSHEKTRKNTGAAYSGGSSSNSASGDKKSLRTIGGAPEKEGSENRGNMEFEVSGDWSFKPDALFASFMSIFDIDDDLDSRAKEGAAVSPIATSSTPGPAVCHSRFDAGSSKRVTKSPSDGVPHKAGVKPQRNWPSDISRNGGRGRSCFRNTLSTRDRMCRAKTSFGNVPLSSTTCSGVSPTCTSSIRKAACPLDLRAAVGGSASDAASARSTAPRAVLRGGRYGVTTAPGAVPGPFPLGRNATVTTDATFSETAEGWFGGEDLSPSELEEPADGVTYPQTWMDDAAAYTLRCVTRSHMEISVLYLHNVGKIVDASLVSGRAQLRCPGFNMLHLRVPFFEPETQIITLQFTTRMSRTHFALLQTLARCHENRILQQQQPPQQHLQQRQHQQQNCRDLEASMEDPRWRRLLRQLRWHRRIDEDRKKDAEVKRYRVDIPVQALSKKDSESRWVLLEVDDGRRPEGAPPAYLARQVYVGWYDDPIDGAVAETLNSHPDILSLDKSIRRLSKGRYEVDGFECRIFLGSYKKAASSSAAAQEKEHRSGEKSSKGREDREHGRQSRTGEGERGQQKQTGRQCKIQSGEKTRQEGSERPTEQKDKNAQGVGEQDTTRHGGEGEEEDTVPIVQEGDTLQPLIDYFKGTLENITWSPPFPTSCIELIPPRFLPPLHDTLVPWEARVERRKAMELACHRAAIREQVAAELLRLQKRPVPPLLYTKHVSPVLVRPAPGAPPVPMTYTWKEEYADVQLVILASGPADCAVSSAPQQRSQFYLQQEQLFCTQQPQQASYAEQRHTQQWQHHLHKRSERLRSPAGQQQSSYIPAQLRQNCIE